MKIPIANKFFFVISTLFLDGLVNSFKFAIVVFFARNVRFRPHGYKHPLLLRAGTSDLLLAYSIFVKKEYKTPFNDKIDLIFDFGANSGYSAVFFAHNYPQAKIVSYEPHPDNFKVLVENTLPYENIEVVNKGIWWRQANLEVVNNNVDSWAFKFHESDQAGCESEGIDDLFQKYSDFKNIMVKMDIEGAESDIFAKTSDWITKTMCIQLEIHCCWKQVFDKMSHFKYTAEPSKENIIFYLEN